MFPMPPNETQRLAALATLEIERNNHSEHFLPLVRLGRSLLDVPELVISVVGEESQRVLAAEHQACGAQFPRSISVCAYTIAGADIFEVSDLTADKRFAAMPYVSGPPYFRFYAGTPLAMEEGVNLGAICVFDHVPRRLDPLQRRQLVDLGRVAGSLLRLHEANAALRRNEGLLRDAATTDALTGCLNRVGLRERIGDLFERSGKEGRAAALIYVDLDHFKAINDRFGHPGGDTVLRAVAERLQTAVRAHDLVGRIGGDEFCVVLRDVGGVTEVERVASRLVGMFRQPIETDGGPVACTVSVGVALAPLHATTREDIAKQADAALYQAKEAGRNGFRIAA